MSSRQLRSVAVIVAVERLNDVDQAQGLDTE